MKKSIIILAISLFGCMTSHAQTAPSFPAKMNLSEGVNIAGVGSGEIEKEAMLNSKGLSLNNTSSSRITSFKMTLISNGIASREFTNEVNGELTPAMRDALKDAPAGSKVYFEYIKCSVADNSTRSLHPASFILK